MSLARVAARATAHATLALAFAGALQAADAAAADVVAAGGRAPEIVAPTIDGTSFRLSAQRGRVVVLDFLTPGCGECELAAPILERDAIRYRARGVRVVVVDLTDAPASRLRPIYRGQLGLARVTVLRDRGRRIARAYGVLELGTTFIVGRDGRVVWHGSWHDSSRELDAAITATL